MIALLSPAKTLDFSPISTTQTTQPRQLKRSESLIKTLRRKSVASIQELMGVSENLAKLNQDRFRAFQLPFTEENAKPAVLAFKGDVYLGLTAETFSEEDLDFAQAHLRILSGLYGLLRPRDLMQAYRLEMGTRLKTRRGETLYNFWRDEITKLLNQDLADSGQEEVVNLASKEYFKSILPKKLKGRLIHIHFQENRDGGFKVIAFNAKKARGRMAHLMIKHRATNVETLKEFDVNGYAFNADLSTENDWYFTL